MTPVEAAKIIGVRPTTVRAAIRNRLLHAQKLKSPNNQFGYVYDVSRQEALRFKKLFTGKGTRFKTGLIKLRMRLKEETREEATTWTETVSKVRCYQWFNENISKKRK